jgi:hypothetical protein
MAVKLPALRDGSTLPTLKIPGTHFCYKLSQPQGHCAAERLIKMEGGKNPMTSSEIEPAILTFTLTSTTWHNFKALHIGHILHSCFFYSSALEAS